MECNIHLPSRWVDAHHFERALGASGDPHSPFNSAVTVYFPQGCKLIIDAAIRLLSLLNQLSMTKSVRLNFLAGEEGVMGYLDRVGFFDMLDPAIAVWPSRPTHSAAAIHRGANHGLVEIARINNKICDEGLPDRLAEAVERNCRSRTDAKEVGGAAFTVFSELIRNIFDHSETLIDGYAALQTYRKGDKLSVAVSDSGAGIMATLRPALVDQYPSLVPLRDVDLLVEIFRQGLSRHGSERGDGLKGSAAKAMKYQADLDVRLPRQRVLLTPSRGAYQPNMAYCHDELPQLWGTHIAFHFRLT